MRTRFKRFCEKKQKDAGYYTLVDKNLCMTPITLLIGPNGTGKTLSLRNIEEVLKKEGIKCIRYSNKNNDIVNCYSEFNKYAEITDLLSAFHSEGERIIDSVEKWANTHMVKNLLEHDDNIWVLFDELDSGLSIDKLYYFLDQLMSILAYEKKRNPNRDVKFIFSCNSYEMLEYFKCNKNVTIILVPTGEIVDIKTYEEFKDLYLDYYKMMYRRDTNGD